MKESTKCSVEYITDAVRRNAKKIKQTLTVTKEPFFPQQNTNKL